MCVLWWIFVTMTHRLTLIFSPPLVKARYVLEHRVPIVSQGRCKEAFDIPPTREYWLEDCQTTSTLSSSSIVGEMPRTLRAKMLSSPYGIYLVLKEGIPYLVD